MSIIKGALASFIIKIGTAGATFLFFLITARILTPEEFGRFGFLFSVGMFFAYVIMFGQHTLLLRWIAACNSKGEFRRSIDLVSRSFLLVVVWIVLCASILYVMTRLFPSKIALSQLEYVLIVTYAAVFAVSELAISILRALGRVVLAIAPRDILWRSIFVATVWVLSFVLSEKLDSGNVFLLLVITLAAVVSVQASYALFVLVRLRSGDAQNSAEFTLEERKDLRRSTIWYWFAGVAAIASANLGVAFASMVLTDAETGGFVAAQKISLLLQLPLVAMNIVLAPKIAELFYNQRREEIQSILRVISIILTVYTIVCFAFILILADWTLYIFNPAFVQYKNSLIILSVGMFVNTICGPTGVLLLMAGGEKVHVILLAIFESLGLLLIFALGPKFGVPGVAMASTIGAICWNLVAVYWCRQNLTIDPSALNLFKIGLPSWKDRFRNS
ncbi:oligosaccharide flippase family protein [uncultured Roseibium sp.]|uniref:oligosaccharide flippase family protein n=1 Tax=uncultured Roseibium sp. TaxID=1936171 RepID=UPI002597D2D9|nr:oligosaccharide flippase family protein [uncultured Roseibium sp.]